MERWAERGGVEKASKKVVVKNKVFLKGEDGSAKLKMHV